MNQVVDLEGHAGFQSLGVQLIAIATDPVPALATVVEQYNVKTPHLSDGGGQVSRSYGSAQWAMHGSEPGHVFVLVGANGKVRWIKDYGALENGGLMYVPPDALYQEVSNHMPPGERSGAVHPAGDLGAGDPQAGHRAALPAGRRGDQAGDGVDKPCVAQRSQELRATTPGMTNSLLSPCGRGLR